MLSAWKILNINFHLAIRNNVFIATAYLLIIPLIRGIANLDAVHAAECLEQSVILIGIILIVPLAAAEQSKSIQEILYTKKMLQWIILLIRLILAFIMLIIMIGVFAEIMVLNHCTFPYGPYVIGTMISAIALGSVGFLISVFTNSVVIGYLVSIGYYMFNFLGYISNESVFCLFAMETGANITKILLSTLLIVITFIFKNGNKIFV